MNKTLVKYGIYSAAFLILFNVATLLIYGTDPKYYDIGEVTGYSAIVLSMVFVYFGIREYKYKELNGEIKFGKALLMGLIIAIFPAILFGIWNVIYVEIIDPEFVDKYYNHQYEKMEASLSAEEFAIEKSNMEAEKDIFSNVFLQFFVMFFTVWVIGLIASITSSIILSGKKK